MENFLRSNAVLLELWSRDEDTGERVGFVCAHEAASSIFYAMLASDPKKGAVPVPGLQGSAGQRATKSAITTLLDVAEACKARRITLGLNAVYATCSDLVCSLLYLGFQVAPSRKSPLRDATLTLDLDIAWPTSGDIQTSDNGYTSTTDYTTSCCEDHHHASQESDADSDSPPELGGRLGIKVAA